MAPVAIALTEETSPIFYSGWPCRPLCYTMANSTFTHRAPFRFAPWRRLAMAFVGLLPAIMPTPGHADLSAARQAFDNGEFFEAISLALPATETQPVEAFTLRADAFLKLERPDQALGQLQRALSHQPESIPLQTRIAQLLRDQGDLQAAVLYFEAAYARNPASEDIASQLIAIMQRQGDRAREEFTSRIALEHLPPGEVRRAITARLGKIYYDTNRLDMARPLLEEAATFDEVTTSTIYLLARTIERNRNESERVLELVQRALTMDANQPDLLLLRGNTYLRLRQEEKAYDDFWKLQEMKHPHWAELPETVRIATAQAKGQLAQVVTQQYGLVIPMAILAGVLVLILVISIFVLMRSK